MNEACRILLICDDELGGLELRRLLGNELRIEPMLGQGRPQVIALDVEEVVASGTWEIGVAHRRYQLCIVAVSAASPLAELARNPALRASIAAMLHLVENGSAETVALQLRPGCDRVLTAPFSRSGLLHAIERQLLTVLAGPAPALSDGRYLALLHGLAERGQRRIMPHLVADDPQGWRYPQVTEHFGLEAEAPVVLERLVDRGICTRVIAHRLRACPTCAGHHLVYGETCARCHAVDFVHETMVHHFACAHVGTEQDFRHGDGLVCPKCHKRLHQIGRDYEKPTGCYRCRACAFIATETRVQARCLSCQAELAPEQTVERLVYAYDLTPQADEAVAANDLGGQDMATVLRNHHTGLYARSFFLFSLQRELDRLRRYAAPLSLVLVRSTRLADMRSESQVRYSEHVQAMWKAATTGLRTLDIPCVWSEGVLALMLPGTALAGAEVVCQRIATTFNSSAPAGDSTTGQELLIGCIQAGSAHVDAEALVRDGLGALAPRGTTASDMVVLADDVVFGEPSEPRG